MTVKEIKDGLNIPVLAGKQALDEPVTGCYIGDLLSWVMGRAEEGDVWLTVMGNVNAIAVAVLAGIPAIVLCEGAPLDKEAAQKAEENGIAVLQTDRTIFSVSCEIAGLLSCGK